MSPARSMRGFLLALGLAAAASAQADPTVTTPPWTCTWCDIQVTWSGLTSPSTSDILKITTPGSTNTINWRNTNGAASGTLPLNVPGGTPFGTYVVRIERAFVILATSAPFEARPSVSGTVTSGGSPLAGVSISGTNAPGACNPITDASGHWGCVVPYGWSGTVTVSKAGSLFSPPSRSYTNVTNHIGGDNFATATTHAVSGTITREGVALSGAALAGTNGASCTSTNASGQYTCAVLPGWSGTVTPSMAQHVFTPASRSYTNVTAAQSAQNYTAQAFWQLTGTISFEGGGLSGAALAGTNGAICTATNASGEYSCGVPPGWSGTVTPSLAGKVFTPASRSYTSVSAAQSAQDYAANAALYQVSGAVTLNGVALVSVAMAASGGPTCTSSNSAGQYSCTVPYGWSGSVTPSASGYSFGPASRSYTSVSANQSAQGFAATLDTATAPLYFVPGRPPEHPAPCCQPERAGGVALGPAGAFRRQRAR